MDAIENVLNGDERCILETMRFIEILLILIFEGRQVPPAIKTSGSFNTVERLDEAEERLQRKLIELIRNKDTESLIESLETNIIDINFNDDVGQTMLNWAAAFGTAEMVEYLCTKGADVTPASGYIFEKTVCTTFPALLNQLLLMNFFKAVA